MGGKIPVVVENESLNAEEYVTMLEEHFLPFRDEFYSNGITLQQNNAPAHSERHTRDFSWPKG